MWHRKMDEGRVSSVEIELSAFSFDAIISLHASQYRFVL